MDRARCVWLFSCCEDFPGRQAYVQESLLKYLTTYLDKMQHGELHYASYALLVNKVEDVAVWKTYIKRVSTLPQVVPINYFHSYKLVQLHL